MWDTKEFLIQSKGDFIAPVMKKTFDFVTKKCSCLKNTHREKAPSNKTPALTKKMNMYIWVVGTSNQLFSRGSQAKN